MNVPRTERLGRKILLLWKAANRSEVPWSGKTFIGAMLLGWGLFNLVEDIIDHHILHLHPVVESHGFSAFDYAFDASGVILIISGWMAIRSAGEEFKRANL